jgi:Domain of unknown function (DUF222)/HNH endonuclease
VFERAGERRPESTLRALTAALADLDPCVDDSTRVDRIRLLEELKSAAAAAQARETAAFVASQRVEQRAAGVPADRIGRGIAAQVALAKRTSPFHAQRYVGWTGILTTELPNTFAVLEAGRISEWRALLVARETAWLSREHRARVDAEIAPRLETLGDRRVEAETKRLAYRLDPQGAVDRIRRAAGDRGVGLRPAPDTMARLTALLPVHEGAATYATLVRDADAAVAAGDPRSRGHIMADLLVERITGQSFAEAVPVEINLVMTDTALLDPDSAEPAHLDGFGPVPAPFARDLALAGDSTAPRWLRRLFLRPATDELVALESRRRTFTPGQRLQLRLRDQWCRTPWCEAPIRHIDHIRPHAEGGPTAVDNGQGYCAACNHAKQAPGWHTVGSGGRAVVTITPTGHRYRSRPPGLPTTSPPSPVERRLAAILRTA